MIATQNGDNQPPPGQARRAGPGEEDRRASFLLAGAALVGGRGPQGATVEEICRLAGAPQASFDLLFESPTECLRQGIEDIRGRLLAPIRAAEGRRDWLRETAAALSGYYAVVAAEPRLAELALVHAYGVDRESAIRATEADVEELSRLFGHGRTAAARLGSPGPPPVTEQLLSHMVLGTAALNLRRGTLDRLAAEAAAVGFLVGASYLGTETAARVLGSPESPAEERR